MRNFFIVMCNCPFITVALRYRPFLIVILIKLFSCWILIASFILWERWIKVCSQLNGAFRTFELLVMKECEMWGDLYRSNAFFLDLLKLKKLIPFYSKLSFLQFPVIKISISASRLICFLLMCFFSFLICLFKYFCWIVMNNLNIEIFEGKTEHFLKYLIKSIKINN